MADLNKLIEMLSGPKATTRYDACEQLRVADESSEAAVLALEKATQDSDPDVVERAEAALRANVHHKMLMKLGKPGAIKDEELAQALQRARLIDFSIGAVGWFVIMSVVWLVLLSPGGTFPVVAFIFVMPVLFVLNIIVLIVLAFSRKWIALGMLSIIAINLAVGQLLRAGSDSLCAVPFIVDYYAGFY